MGTEGYKFTAKDKQAIRWGLDDMLKLELENSFHDKLAEVGLYRGGGF
jgi:hypothetical protein